MTAIRSAAVVLVAAALAGCGSATGSSGNGAGVSETSGSATSLTITWDDGGGKTGTWQLTCDPAGGDHPDPEAACQALTSGGTVGLNPVKPGTLCSQIYGGPQTATIAGTWQGKPVSAKLKRTNGCEVARWKALKGLLPDA